MNLTILDSVEALVKRVEEDTEKPVQWVQASGMASMVECKPAGKNDDSHILYISESFKDPEGQHLIACKGYQILRLFKEPENQRLLPSSGKEHFNNARMKLSIDASGRPDLAKAVNEDEIVRAWIFGVVNQLISQPADIYIQKAIHEEIPDLKDATTLVLEQQFLDFTAALRDDVRLYSPKTIYDASLLMNSVYLHMLDRFLGCNFMSRVETLPQKRKINRLLDATLEMDEDSPAGDRARTDLWAETLGIRDWYEWVSPETLESQ